MPSLNKPKRMAYNPKPKRNKSEDYVRHKLYDAKRWRRIRASQLLDMPVCEPCLVIGLTVEATQVDHIVSLGNGGSEADDRNLMSICAAHHGYKSAAEGQGYVPPCKQTYTGFVPIDRDAVIESVANRSLMTDQR